MVIAARKVNKAKKQHAFVNDLWIEFYDMIE